jgi:hypothetical protein
MGTAGRGATTDARRAASKEVAEMSQTEPPARHARTVADHRELAKVVLFYALALGAVLFAVAALLVGIAWLDLADAARRPF